MAVEESEGVLTGDGESIERVRCSLCNSSIYTPYFANLQKHIDGPKHMRYFEIYREVRANYPSINDNQRIIAARSKVSHFDDMPEGIEARLIIMENDVVEWVHFCTSCNIILKSKRGLDTHLTSVNHNKDDAGHNQMEFASDICKLFLARK